MEHQRKLFQQRGYSEDSIAEKRKASGLGKHLTILPYGWVRFITFPIM